jgi:rubrerythrin
MTSNGMTRRELFARSAATAASISLAISINAAARKVQAKVDPPVNASKDNDTLNALLNAEWDAIATYTTGAGIIDGDTTDSSDAAVKTRALVKKVALHFQSQHQDHANALKKLIQDNGGTPAEQTTVPQIPGSFPKTGATTADVIKLGADKEKAAAYTYADVVKTLSTQAAAKLAASIGGVETQHFVVLYLLAEQLIAPTASTDMNAALVVPASFILDAGVDGTAHLDNLPALDALLKLDEK